MESLSAAIVKVWDLVASCFSSRASREGFAPKKTLDPPVPIMVSNGQSSVQGDWLPVISWFRHSVTSTIRLVCTITKDNSNVGASLCKLYQDVSSSQLRTQIFGSVSHGSSCHHHFNHGIPKGSLAASNRVWQGCKMLWPKPCSYYGLTWVVYGTMIGSVEHDRCIVRRSTTLRCTSWRQTLVRRYFWLVFTIKH